MRVNEISNETKSAGTVKTKDDQNKYSKNWITLRTVAILRTLVYVNSIMKSHVLLVLCKKKILPKARSHCWKMSEEGKDLTVLLQERLSSVKVIQL